MKCLLDALILLFWIGPTIKGHMYRWHLLNFKFKRYFRSKKTGKLQKTNNIIIITLETDNNAIQRRVSVRRLC